MGKKKEVLLKQVETTHRSVILNRYIDELLDLVAEHMKISENELIRNILSKNLERMARKINKQANDNNNDDDDEE
ncbi:MAG: hypothetical protein QXV17_08750 [Candidatus Micrarchaeaceae archaeon]